jgi:uncharacterized protein (DUF2147 family)
VPACRQTVSPPAPPATTAPAKTIVAAPPPPSTRRPHREARSSLRLRRAAAAGSTGFDSSAAAAIGRKPVETAQPAPQVERVTHQAEEEPSDSPIGDWQTEGKGTVRIAKCGNALCGFVLGSSNEKGEAILINMKPKTERQWIGGIYSQDSGETYYGTMSMKGSTRFASKPARSAASTAPATIGAASRAAPTAW